MLFPQCCEPYWMINFTFQWMLIDDYFIYAANWLMILACARGDWRVRVCDLKTKLEAIIQRLSHFFVSDFTWFWHPLNPSGALLLIFMAKTWDLLSYHTSNPLFVRRLLYSPPMKINNSMTWHFDPKLSCLKRQTLPSVRDLSPAVNKASR